MTSPTPDGRRARGERNKSAVVAALLDLYESGEIHPSAARVADRAGVSERSVFRYFDDMGGLAAAAIDLQMQRVRPLYDGLSVEGSFEERLEAVLDHRLRLFDAVQAIARATAVLAHRVDLVAATLEQRRSYLRAQAIDQFQPELGSVSDRAAAAHAIDAALSFEMLEYWRSSAGLTDVQIRAAISCIVRSVLVLAPADRR